jgi:hypothetical protein
MSITLKQTLTLVGKLDDSPGDDTPRERFRQHLTENVTEIGQVRDYVEECLRNKGDQYNRALQDLINHLGHFLEFSVTFGRYQGVQGQIGFDGHWQSPTGINLVVEVKTTEVYSVKTSTLVGYIDELISTHVIPSWDQALGLYVIGRPDPEIRQLENSIIAEKRSDQLRIISVDSLLSLAEMMNEYDVNHENILAVIQPSGPAIDPIVELMANLVAQPKPDEPSEATPEEKQTLEPKLAKAPEYWLTPVASDEKQTAEEVVQNLVGEEKIYAFGERTPGRKHIKPGDWICFYATGNGVIAHARVKTAPEKKHHPKVRHPDKYPWVFCLDKTKLYLDNPTVIDAELRKRLDAFEDRDPGTSWAWFVQATRKVSEHDFRVLTRRQEESS